MTGLIDAIGPELIGLAIVFGLTGAARGWRWLRRPDRIAEVGTGQQPDEQFAGRDDRASILTAGMEVSLALAMPVAGYFGRQLWAIGLIGAYGAGILLLWAWRRLNNPEPPPFPFWPEVSLPQESVIGFGIGISIVGLLLTVGLLTL